MDILIDKGKTFLLGDYFPMKYNESTRLKIQRWLELERLVPYTPNEAKDLSPEELNHLNYLILSIDAFYKQKNKFHTPRNVLIPRIMNPEGTKLLKRMKLKSFLKIHDEKLIETPSWWDETPHIFLEDIGEVYNYNYAMYWEAPDENDYLLSQTPVIVDEEMKAEFITFINKFISTCDDFESIRSEEILFRVSSSKALYKNESVPMYSSKYACMKFSSKRKAGKRVLITTGPGQGRDAIINEIDDLNTIQLINENVRNFLQKNFRRHLLLNNAEISKKRYFAESRKSHGFYCRDIKKEGITKPKWIIKEILLALHNRYSDNMAFHFPDFYDGPWYEGDKGDRGHGLGMANELTTLMQILIFYFTNKVLGDEGQYIVSVRSLFLNDDAIIFFEEEESNVEDFVDTDFDICEKLGIMAQKDKSFKSNTCGVFCELYFSKKFPNINDKESYLLREQNIILRSGSILEAKFLLGNIKGSIDQVENLLKTVYSKFGYEFHPRELNWPISFGGARPMKLRGTDFSLRMIEGEKDLKPIFKAYEANKHRRLWDFNKFLKKYRPPILEHYPHLIYEDENLISKLGLVGDFDLACMFFRPTKEHKFHRSLEKLREKRSRTHDSIKTAPTLDEFCKDYSTHSLNNISLFPHQIERYIKVKLFFISDFKDPYKVINPVASFLNFLDYKKDYSIPSTTWGLFQSDASLLNEKSVFARNRAMNTLSLIDRFEEDYEAEILVFPEDPNDIEVFMESYPKPWLTSELVVEVNNLPIPRPEYRNPDLKRRKEVYGTYLQYRHIVLAQSISWRELKNILIFEQAFSEFAFDIDFWEKVLHRLKENNTHDYDEKSSSSDSDDKFDDDPFTGNIITTLRVEDFKIDVLPEYDMKEESLEEISEPSSESEVSDEEGSSRVKTVEKTLKNKDETNPFLKAHGPLPEGDMSVYGSEDWIKWFVEQNVLDLEEYLAADEDLATASTDVLTFKRFFQLTGGEALQKQGDEVKFKLRNTVKWSWISHYFCEYIDTPTTEDDEPVEFDVFG